MKSNTSFHPLLLFILISLLILWSCINPPSTPTATLAPTTAMIRETKSLVTYTPTPSLAVKITTSVPFHNFPSKFPLSPLTKSQILDVGMCDIRNLASERYPKIIIDNQFNDQFSPVTACDWAVLAFVYARQNQNDTPNPYGVKDSGKGCRRKLWLCISNANLLFIFRIGFIG